jgi:hypothetical protein
MTLQEKQSLIKEQKEVVQGVLNIYLDSVYDLTDPFYNEDGSLKSSHPLSKEVVNFVESLRKDAECTEKVRLKVLENDFNLSLFEINVIAICFKYVRLQWSKDIERIQAASKEADDIISSLESKS